MLPYLDTKLGRFGRKVLLESKPAFEAYHGLVYGLLLVRDVVLLALRQHDVQDASDVA